MAPSDPASAAPFIVEQQQRLSHSILWRWQRRFFERAGIAAWRDSTVPSYITSNPFIAGAYARLVLGFLRDWRAAAPLDPSQPIYIVELGAGSGRFAYHVLRRLGASLRRSALRDLRVTYVLTDFAPANLSYWDEHPALRPFIAQGLLDIASFDAARPGPLELRHAGVTLDPGQVANPLVVIANYVFDSLPMDAFSVESGQLYECPVTLTLDAPPPDIDDPALLELVRVGYERRPAAPECYADAHYNQLLQDYQARLGDTTLTFPCAALDCVGFFRHLAGGRLLLIAGDKGYAHEEDLLDRGDPALTLHGSFSVAVNYHALAAYARLLGGQALQTPHRATSLTVAALLFGAPPGGYVETDHAYYEAIEQGGPDDFFMLKKAVEPFYDELTIEQILGYLRLSGWDTQIFWGCFPALLAQVEQTPRALRAELGAALRQIWEMHYPIGEERDLAFHLGMLHYGLGDYAEALEYWRHSLQHHGDDPSTTYNMAIAYQQLGQSDEALAALERTLALSPAFEEARAMRIRLQAERERRARARRPA